MPELFGWARSYRVAEAAVRLEINIESKKMCQWRLQKAESQAGGDWMAVLVCFVGDDDEEEEI